MRLVIFSLGFISLVKHWPQRMVGPQVLHVSALQLLIPSPRSGNSRTLQLPEGQKGVRKYSWRKQEREKRMKTVNFSHFEFSQG